MLIRPGNSKLGEVPCFSILAVETCPGRTEVCESDCYATNGFFRMTNVTAAHQRNWDASKEPDFVKKMIDEIRQLELKILRVHVAGDFYSAPYIRKWIQIAQGCPDVTFYAYTRSWRRAKLLDALIDLANVDNFHLWFSCDKITHSIDGVPPVDGIRSCYMQCEHGESVPDYCDLVFRVKRDTIVKKINGCLVCPAENGIKPKRHCEQCQFCWSTAVIQPAVPG